MNKKIEAEYGTWKSPISSDLIVSNMVRMGKVCLDGDTSYWLETRPEEGGRDMVSSSRNDQITDVTPLPFNARTRVHEFGGGSFSAFDGQIFFSNLIDQRIYVQSRDSNGKFSEPSPLTPSFSEIARHLRFADITIDRQRKRLIAVQEDHRETDSTPPASLVAVPLDGSAVITKLVDGYDFYSSPKVSPDGSKLAWFCWNHPNMPWYGTELWLADLAADGNLENPRKVAGGVDEAIFQPEWSPAGQLYFCSDLSGWWNIYRLDQNEKTERVLELDAECGFPHMYFGHSSYAFVDNERIIFTYAKNGMFNLAELNTVQKTFVPIQSKFGEITFLRANAQKAVFRGGAPDQPVSIIEMDVKTRDFKTLRQSFDLSGSGEDFSGCLSYAQPIEFPTENGLNAHAFFYPAKNDEYAAPATALPPLIVRIHGGPNNQHFNTLDLSIQYWTSRGFALVDVNYGGSTGFGREYRQRLRGNWGVVDNQDAVNAARYLANKGLVDPSRMIITGLSAGGYATICGVTFYDDFACGSAQFGVSDMESMAQLFHKFQSNFLQTMIAPFPEQREVYKRRSAINFVEQINCPILLSHGLLDTIVPIEQSERLAHSLNEKKKPFAYVKFDDEPHVFRKAENVKKFIETELSFFAAVLGFQPADKIPPVKIEHFQTMT